jgi:hypothetical protein
MDEIITECETLVTKGIASEYKNPEPTYISDQPERLIEFGSVSLWGQSQEPGEKKVDLRLPTTRAWLLNLARSGTGPGAVYEGVKYKFISSTLLLAAAEHRGRMLTHELQTRTPARLPQSQTSINHHTKVEPFNC